MSRAVELLDCGGEVGLAHDVVAVKHRPSPPFDEVHDYRVRGYGAHVREESGGREGRTD